MLESRLRKVLRYGAAVGTLTACLPFVVVPCGIRLQAEVSTDALDFRLNSRKPHDRFIHRPFSRTIPAAPHLPANKTPEGSQSGGRQGRSGVVTPMYRYRLVRSYPHDRQAFTQGLVYHNGFLYEGTGQLGQSSIRKVRLETGEVVQVRPLDSKYFGEGIVIWKNSLIQLTWQHGIGFVYDRETFAPQRTFTYTGEGWGLTHDGTRLIMSDGSPTGTLRYFDPNTLRESGRLVVRDRGTPVAHLNELEFVKGEIYANVWQTERIARISPKTGRVTGWIDLRGLLDPREAAGVDVMNGIAYDAEKDRLFVTGKLWPRVFEIEVLPARH